MKQIIFYCLVLTPILLSACAASATPTPEPPTAEPTVMEATVSFQLTSDAFAYGQFIPAKYTCSGKNISPALAWNEPPAGTQSFALIVDDPDAGSIPYVHWVAFNISASVRALPEAMPYYATLPNGSPIGKVGLYQGPCPPSGTHHYFFKLYALDKILNDEISINKDKLLEAMDGHILAQSELMGTFQK